LQQSRDIRPKSETGGLSKSRTAEREVVTVACGADVGETREFF